MSFVASCAVFRDILTLIDAPQWPPKPTLLTDDFGILKLDFESQQDWGADEWKKYAQYLEQSGQRLKNDLVKTKRELAAAKAKLSRRKKLPPTSSQISLLGGLYDEQSKAKPKRGRKPGSKYAGRIAEIERIKKQTGQFAPKILDDILGHEGAGNWMTNQEKTIR